MTNPVSRYGADLLKEGPCGVTGGERTQNVSYFEPGETIEVRWVEYVDHPSHYRVAFDTDGHDDFVDPATMMEFYSNDSVLLDGIEDNDSSNPTYAVMVELPDIECDNCTLQVIQVMYDKPPYEIGGNDIYYQCADLVLTTNIPPNPNPNTGGNPRLRRHPDTPPTTSCSTTPPGTAIPLAALFVLILAARRRGTGSPS